MIKQLIILLIGLILAVVTFFITVIPTLFYMSNMLPCSKDISNTTALITLGTQLFSIFLINILYHKIGKFNDKNLRRYITVTFPQILIVIVMCLYLFTLIQQYQELQTCNKRIYRYKTL